jgi:hypothetical protein
MKLTLLILAAALSLAPLTAHAQPFTVTEADKTAAFKAAGFKKVGGQWKSDCGDPGTASYMPGAIEVQDLNGDGRPEIWITEGGTYCYGNSGGGFWLMTKNANGAWTKMLNDVGIQNVLKGKRYGWPDIEVGGPGFGKFPAYRYDGKKYVHTP